MAGDWYTITELAALHRTTLRTLRFYEQQGMLDPTRVAGKRLYSAADRLRLELILKGRRLGFTLSEIRRLIEAMTSANPANEVCKTTDLLTILGRDEIAHRISELQNERKELQLAIDELKGALSA